MNVLIFNVNRRCVLSCLFLMFWMCSDVAMPEPQETLPDPAGVPSEGPDLTLDLHARIDPVERCHEELYIATVTNHGPGTAPDVTFNMRLSSGLTLRAAQGCLDGPGLKETCRLGHIPPGESREVILHAIIHPDAPSGVVLEAQVFSSLVDPVPQNNVALEGVTVFGNMIHEINILEPLPATIFHESSAAAGIDLEAEVIYANGESTTFDNAVQWSSDRLGELGLGSALHAVPFDTFGVHTITATVTDSCGDSVSTEVSIGVAPNEPISTGDLIAFDKMGEQIQPKIASTGPDSFVVVWSDLNDEGGDDTDGSIRAQRFHSKGTRVGDEIRVNVETDGLQHRPAVAGRRDGSFIVVWQSTDPNSLSSSIYMRLFDSLGVPSDAVKVNLKSLSRPRNPDVAIRRDGSVLVVWEEPSPEDPDGGVRARYFDSSGHAHEEFPINSYTAGTQGRPAVVAGPKGTFAVAWHSRGSFGSDKDGYSIQLRPFDAFLQPLRAEIQVNRTTEGDQTHPALSVNTRGQWVVVWKSYGNLGQKRTLRIGGGFTEDLGEWNQADFEPFAPIVLGPNDLPRALSPPDVAISPDGDFVVIWAEGPEMGPFSVQMRSFFGLANSPTPIGVPFVRDPHGLGLPAIAYSHGDVDGTHFVAVWETEGDGTGSSLEGLIEALDVTGSRVSIPFAPVPEDWALVADDAFSHR